MAAASTIIAGAALALGGYTTYKGEMNAGAARDSAWEQGKQQKAQADKAIADAKNQKQMDQRQYADSVKRNRQVASASTGKGGIFSGSLSGFNTGASKTLLGT